MKKILLLIATGAALLGGTIAFAACSNGTEYSVARETCEHGSVIVSDASAKAGEKVILAAHPDAGYRLVNFLVDGEKIEGVSFQMPQKDVTVSAQFTPVTYSITYVLGDAIVTEGNPATYTVESAAELIPPQKEGYEICGWYTYYAEPKNEWEIVDPEDYRVTSLQGLYGNLTLYAEYYNPPHVIELHSEDGNCFVEGYFYEACYGDTVNVVAEPSYGYELDRITVNGEEIDGTSFTMPARDVEIIVEFKLIRYAITYVLDGGVNAPENPEYYTVDDDYVTLCDAEKEGCSFYGWYYDEEYTQPVDSGFDAYVGHPVTLYALFVEDVDDYE